MYMVQVQLIIFKKYDKQTADVHTFFFSQRVL